MTETENRQESYEDILGNYSISTSENAQIWVFQPVADALNREPEIDLATVRETLLMDGQPRVFDQDEPIKWYASFDELREAFIRRAELNDEVLLDLFPVASPSIAARLNMTLPKGWERSPYFLLMEFSQLFAAWLIFNGYIYCVGKMAGRFALLKAASFENCAAAYEGRHEDEIGREIEGGFFRPWSGTHRPCQIFEKGIFVGAVSGFSDLRFVFRDDLAELIARSKTAGAPRDGKVKLYDKRLANRLREMEQEFMPRKAVKHDVFEVLRAKNVLSEYRCKDIWKTANLQYWTKGGAPTSQTRISLFEIKQYLSGI